MFGSVINDFARTFNNERIFANFAGGGIFFKFFRVVSRFEFINRNGFGGALHSGNRPNDRSVFFVGFSTGNGVALLFEFLRERFGVASAKYGCKKCNYKNNGKNFANVLFHKQ